MKKIITLVVILVALNHTSYSQIKSSEVFKTLNGNSFRFQLTIEKKDTTRIILLSGTSSKAEKNNTMTIQFSDESIITLSAKSRATKSSNGFHIMSNATLSPEQYKKIIELGLIKLNTKNIVLKIKGKKKIEKTTKMAASLL